jgi:hypothetical protein
LGCSLARYVKFKKVKIVEWIDKYEIPNWLRDLNLFKTKVAFDEINLSKYVSRSLI